MKRLARIEKLLVETNVKINRLGIGQTFTMLEFKAIAYDKINEILE